jgi:Ca-activated chloride channel homolog
MMTEEKADRRACGARWAATALLSLATLVSSAGCGSRSGGSGGTASGGSLHILSGSENKSLEPILQRFASQNGATVSTDYLGSVDMMIRLEDGAAEYDAVWPANSLWVDMGDRKRLVKRSSSIMRSPVVFGVKKSIAQRLGWVGKDVTVEQILKAAEGGKLRFMMTSATQSNSGASAYLGFLYAFAGRPEVLTQADLARSEVRDKITRILGAVDRSAGSSGWLKDLFVQKYEDYDAMVNYEALVIEANRELEPQGKEPLYAVYPVDGLAVADSPLGYVNHGDAGKEQLFTKLQSYLESAEVQKEIMASGRRTGLAGMESSGADPAVFNPEWGIDVKRVLSPIRFPKPETIRQALDLYQTAFRKPSFTVYCLDVSGSMKGRGISDLKSAMRLLLNQDQARRYLLQASDEDVTVVIPFNGDPLEEWSVSGNDTEKQAALLAKVMALQPAGGTDIYTPVVRALDTMKRRGDLSGFFPAVILMTDGKSNGRGTLMDVEQRVQTLQMNLDVPVFAILFGDASEEQLQGLTASTSGRVFDGRKDLVQAFREARGYNQ